MKTLALTAAGLLATAWLFVQADRITAPTPQPTVPVVHVAPLMVTTPHQPLPPFWHSTPAPWCAEDMICWIGSDADGRSDNESLVDWRFQLRHAHVFENQHPVGPALAESLAESGYPRATTRNWELCTVWLNYDGHHLFCPDGFTARW